MFWDRFESLVKSDRGADARRLLDEAVSDPARDTAQLRSYTVAGLNALVGRHRAPPVDSALMRQNRARFDSMLRNRPPEPPGWTSFAGRLAAHDSAGARRALARTDSSLTPPDGMRRFPRIGTMHLESATSHLALGDTSVAEARLARIEDVFNHGRFQFVTLMYEGGPWLGRAWMLSGNLAAARRRFPDAARMYRRVIGLWGGGDPELQPLVDEARARLEALPVR